MLVLIIIFIALLVYYSWFLLSLCHPEYGMSPACTAVRIAFPRLKKPWKCAVPLVFPALYNAIVIFLYWFIILLLSYYISLLPYCIELIICSTFSLPPHLHTPLPFYISPVFPLFYGFIVLFVYVSIIIFSFIYYHIASSKIPSFFFPIPLLWTCGIRRAIML